MGKEAIYWVGADAVILEDVTEYGLARKHIVRRAGVPDVLQFYGAAPEGAGCAVYMDDEGNGHVWIWWKDAKQASKTTEWMA